MLISIKILSTSFNIRRLIDIYSDPPILPINRDPDRAFKALGLKGETLSRYLIQDPASLDPGQSLKIEEVELSAQQLVDKDPPLLDHSLL